MPFAQKDVQWVIEGAQGVAEVDSSGEVHARAFGTTAISATIQGVRSGTSSIDVSDAAPSLIMFSMDTVVVGSNGSTIAVYLSLSPQTPVIVTLSDPSGLVKFDKDTLIFDIGRTHNDVMISAIADGKTTIVASDVGKLFAPDSLVVFVGKAAPQGVTGRVVPQATAGRTLRSTTRRTVTSRTPPLIGDAVRPKSP
jgi:hypothetical protein